MGGEGEGVVFRSTGTTNVLKRCRMVLSREAIGFVTDMFLCVCFHRGGYVTAFHSGELSSMTSWRQATFELIPDFCSQLALYCSFDIRHMELRDSVTMKESFRNRVNPDFPIFGLGLGNQFFAPSNTPFVEGSS